MLLNYRHFTEDQISTIKFKVKHLSGRQKTKRQKANVVNRGGGVESCLVFCLRVTCETRMVVRMLLLLKYRYQCAQHWGHNVAQQT